MRNVMFFIFVLGALSAAGKVILSKPGQTAKFKCEAKAGYQRLEWTREGSMIFSVNGRSGMSRKGQGDIAKRAKGSDSNLEISNVKKEDAGKFICQVDRVSQEHTLLVVSVSVNSTADFQVGSDATLLCEVTGLNSGTTVKWKGPGVSQTGPEVQLNPLEKSHKGKWECLFTHDTVTYNESVTIKVKEPVPKPAVTTTPIKKPADITSPACAPDCAPGLSPLLELPWWIWVAIGVGSLVVVLLLVLVIILCKKIRRKKRKHHMRQNGHQPLKPRQYCQCNRPTAAAAKPQQGRRREKPVALPRQPLLME